MLLQQFNFSVEYKPGKNHGNADALSRLQLVFKSMTDIRTAQAKDLKLKTLIDALEHDKPLPTSTHSGSTR